jgi:uracil-DNA glycosylase family 4
VSKSKTDPRQLCVFEADALGAQASALLQQQQRVLDNCRLCPRSLGRLHPLIGRGETETPLVLVVGHSPSDEEDRDGKAYAETADHTRMLTALRDVPAYYTYALPCAQDFGDRNEGLSECRKHLVSRINILNPGGILAVGYDIARHLAPALRSMLDSEIRHKVFGYQDRVPMLVWPEWAPHMMRQDIQAAHAALVQFAAKLQRRRGN